MEFSKITAVIRTGKLDAVEKELLKLRVPGVSISQGKGFSDNANFFLRSGLRITYALRFLLANIERMKSQGQ